MKLKDLQAALLAVHPGALLVSPRVLDRGLQQRFRLPSYRIWDIPHRGSLVVDRTKLSSFIEPDDLELKPDQVLPDRVILLPKPNGDRDNQIDDETLLAIYWRRLFHACLHLELERQLAAGELTAAAIRDRIDRLGPIVWAEAKRVLVEENWLAAAATEEEFYVEFVAVFLELKFFLPHVTEATFPAIREEDQHQVEHVLAEGLQTQAIFAQTRLHGAKEPAELEDPGTDEANDFFNSLVEQAKRATAAKNHVQAAILRLKASRVAPAEQTTTMREAATEAIRALVDRLRNSLEFDKAAGAEWVRHLDKLLEKADQDRFPVEADLLYDLQNACRDNERSIYTLSVVDWALSGGKRPVQRKLSSQQHVRVLRHLRNAQGRLTAARITSQERTAFSDLIEVSIKRREDGLRERYRPVLQAALEDSGFRPKNVPEEAAQEKLIEEILDRFIEAGFFSFGDLRDILVNNQMKMPDVSSPKELLRGDPLLQLDRRLGHVLDGVYHPGEFYLRGLERVTSLFFGTALGRVLTKYLLLPFGAGFLVVQAVFVTWHLVAGFFGHAAAAGHAATDDAAVAAVVAAAMLPAGAETLGEAVAAVAAVATAEAAVVAAARDPEQFLIHGRYWQWNLGLSAGLGVLVFAYLHWGAFRRGVHGLLRGLGDLLVLLFVTLPRGVARSAAFRWFVDSWPVQIFYWLLLGPLLVTLALWFVVPEWFPTWWHAGGIFAAAAVVLGTRAGRGFLGVLGHAVGRFIDVLREGFLQGLVKWVSDAFQRLVRVVEGFFHGVEESLRVRAGQSDWSRVVRLVLGLIWFPIGALARFYFIVLIEPGFNPIKMPISILMAKLMNPVWFLLVAMLPDPSGLGVFGYALYAFAIVTITLLPDAVTFLLWELGSNWQLYEATRPAALAPVVVGTHGETVRGLLQPGFHSGTVPALFQKLRRAMRTLYRPQSWQYVRRYERHLEEVEQAVKQFVARNLLALLRRNRHWAGIHVEVAAVQLAVASIRVVLTHPRHAEPLVIEFALQDGWLVAGMAERGWFDELNAEQLWPLNTALAALYKLAGVQLVRDQIQRVLGGSMAGFEITRPALVVWADAHRARTAEYRWERPAAVLVPCDPATHRPAETGEFPRVPADQLIYERVPLLWKDFVAASASESSERQHADVLPTGRRLVVAGRTTIMERHLEPDANHGVPAANLPAPPAGHAGV